MKIIREENVKGKKYLIQPGYYSTESELFLLPDDTLYKRYKGALMHENKHRVKYLLEKMKYASYMPSGIIVPKYIVTDNKNGLRGYTMERAKGINLDTFERECSAFHKTDLYRYRDIYYRLKEIIEKAGDDIVFPNLLDLRNIFVTKNSMSLVSFDDMQIGDVEGYIASDIECNYGGPILRSDKYYEDGLYTKNMDIRSLIYIYFLIALNFNLSYFSEFEEGELDHQIQKTLYMLGIEDDNITKVGEKIKLLFTEDNDNEYIDDFVDYITEEGQLVYFYDFYLKKPRKQLILK